MLLFYAQSTVKGHIWAKQNGFLLEVAILIHYSVHSPLLRIEDFEKIKLNEPGRQTLGR